MIYLELFLVYLQIGAFSFGGGYAAMPLIQSLCVNEKHWLSMSEFADLTTIAEMTPGPIAVKSATFIGQKMAGLPGAITCTIACILPSVVIVLILAFLYEKYAKMEIVRSVLGELRPAVVAMIAGAGMTILLLGMFGDTEISFASIRPIETILFVVSLFLLRKKKCGPIQIVFLTALAGVIAYMIV